MQLPKCNKKWTKRRPTLSIGLNQIGMKLGAKHVIYQKLANFMWKMDSCVKRIESVMFNM